MNRTQRAIKKQYREAVSMIKKQKNDNRKINSSDIKRKMKEEKETRKLTVEYKCRAKRNNMEVAID